MTTEPRPSDHCPVCGAAYGLPHRPAGHENRPTLSPQPNRPTTTLKDPDHDEPAD